MDDLLRDFIVETREGIEALDSELVRFEQSPENPDLLSQVFRLIHTIKGTCGFIGLPRMQAVAHAAETVLGGFRDGSTPVSESAVSAVLEAVDVIRRILDGLARNGEEPIGDDGALVLKLEAATIGDATSAATPPTSAESGPLLQRLGGEATLDAALEPVVANLAAHKLDHAFEAVDPDRLQSAVREALVAAARGFCDHGQWLSRLTALTGGPIDDPTAARWLKAIAGGLLALDISEQAVAELCKSLASASEPPAASSAQAVKPPYEPATVAADVAAPDTETGGPQTIRVGVDALEHLMTVASELVLIRNQLLQLLRADPESPFAAPLHRLNQVTSELQEGVMTARMQPISGAWAKLPRLVRDLARDLGKKIDLQLHGQDTELDRQVLELIKDPLTHMIRNAADHGLESPEERLALGKPEAGRICLAARHEGGAIVIEISDDGRGLMAGRIRAKAVAKGLATLQQVDAMSDAEARRLIFLPGFSTTDTVTAVSGRGVGMDVVRTNVERIGGVIELSSVEGQGSRFMIRIPLTLTIVSALIIECSGERFAMPQASVVELVSASDGSINKIEYINGSAVMRLRDRLLPLVSLQSLLGLPEPETRSGETCIVVARAGAFTYGVVVDRVFDTEEIVVKPVASVLRHLRVYSGATILGDGAVILILDLKGLSPDTGAATGLEALDADDALSVIDDTRATLIFRSAGGALRATPLSSVSRIEELSLDQIDKVDGRAVVQYRGRLMPVVESDGRPAEPFIEGGASDRPMLVFTREDEAIGVLVEEIVDIVDTSAQPELRANSPGSLGSLIIDGQATDLIDIAFFWRAADAGGPAPAVADAPALAASLRSPLRKLLIVDGSPFCQMLLRPLLAQAGYDVVVADSPGTALKMHHKGEMFDLILADTTLRGDSARQFASALAEAQRWHATPLLGLGLHKAGAAGLDETQLLSAVNRTLAADIDSVRGAA